MLQRNQALTRTEPPIDYLTAAEATALLNVKPQTLYTYVSRGLIRSISQPDAKEKLYAREDLERVRARAGARLGQNAAAESALRWGQPVVDTAITEITVDGPRYRGQSAVALAAANRSFEAIAELLWTGVEHEEPHTWGAEAVPPTLGPLLDSIVGRETRPPFLRVLTLATSLIGATEGSEIHGGTTVPAARQLILTLAGCLGYFGTCPAFRAPQAGDSVARHALAALGVAVTPERVAALNAALVCSADHELSSATFAARVAASTGAELRACIVAALGTHSGPLVGGSCDRVEDLLGDAASPDVLRARLIEAERAGRRLPGFNLIVYPKGDPRARFLIERASLLAPTNRRTQALAEFVARAEADLDLKPSIEIGLVTLATALDLPPRAAGGLWAIARTAGWIAHVMEQRRAGFILRPRARYAALA